MSLEAMETVFSAMGLLVLPFWALAMLAPRWSVTRRVFQSPWIAAGPAIVYVVLITPALPAVVPIVLSPTLPAVAQLLGSPAGATIGWAHFLAFDLFVGRWIYLEAQERGTPWWVSSPVLFLTLMLGPIGFLSWLGVRRLWTVR